MYRALPCSTSRLSGLQSLPSSSLISLLASRYKTACRNQASALLDQSSARSAIITLVIVNFPLCIKV